MRTAVPLVSSANTGTVDRYSSAAGRVSPWRQGLCASTWSFRPLSASPTPSASLPSRYLWGRVGECFGLSRLRWGSGQGGHRKVFNAPCSCFLMRARQNRIQFIDRKRWPQRAHHSEPLRSGSHHQTTQKPRSLATIFWGSRSDKAICL